MTYADRCGTESVVTAKTCRETNRIVFGPCLLERFDDKVRKAIVGARDGKDFPHQTVTDANDSAPSMTT